MPDFKHLIFLNDIFISCLFFRVIAKLGPDIGIFLFKDGMKFLKLFHVPDILTNLGPVQLSQLGGQL